MGKSQKKKQALVAFELSKETVLGFTPGDFLSIDDSWAALPTVVEVLLSSLQDAHSFKEQVLIIQSHKSKIRKFLTAENTSRPELVSAVRILLQLYLLPKYTPLRNSLEWIGETIGRIERGLLLSLREVMAETVGAIMLHFCISVAKFSCTSENVFGEIKEEIPLELLMAWTATFNIIAVLDSDFLLLDLAYVYSDDEYILLDVLISALSRVIQFCTATIVVSVESADKQAGSAELLRYGECCSEASRGIMTALKARKSTFVVNAQVSKELDLVANVMSSLLVKEGIDRDLATSVGMCIAAILWFNQPKECRSSISFHCCQILAVLSLLLNYQINDQLRTIEHALYGIPHVIINGIPKYSFIARTAIVRGIIVIYSDEVLFSFPGVDQIMEIRDYLCNSIPAFEGSQILEEQIASQPLIISALFEFMNYVSDHELPLVKNYGFYSFEAWLTKIIAIIQRTGSYAVMVRDLSSLSFHESLFTISSKALLAWSHPSKQVIPYLKVNRLPKVIALR